MQLPMFIVDAFAEQPLAGNPAAVCPLDARQQAPSTLLKSAVVLAATLFSTVMSVAAAAPRTLRLGQMELVYDAERWRAEAAGDDVVVVMQPSGAIARKLDPVTITRSQSKGGRDDCHALARRELLGSHYEEPTSSNVEIAGAKGLAPCGAYPSPQRHAQGRDRLRALPRPRVPAFSHQGQLQERWRNFVLRCGPA